ncbi:uncharacterized protein RAG0_04158 [Rhynchosporium agropyri]|uniref:Uncharacterized protein n=1 Tax=Rhynchosporium agropyri TaxID=914238 RepID=A0A1E1K7Q5_9HELO|nr:uncharacterized protein RAG0_04158 [Rhynchosporium agropyri]
MTISETTMDISTWFDTQNTQDSPSEDVYVVFILDRGHRIEGLILLPFEDHAGQYSRIGCFSSYLNSNKEEEAWHELQCDVHDTDCIEIQDGQFPYIIELV